MHNKEIVIYVCQDEIRIHISILTDKGWQSTIVISPSWEDAIGNWLWMYATDHLAKVWVNCIPGY